MLRKLLILCSLLADMVAADGGARQSCRDACFWILAWHGVFRSGELVAMQLEDIVVHAEGLVLLVRKSKTDEVGLGQFVSLLPALIQCTPSFEAWSRPWAPSARVWRGVKCCTAEVGSTLISVVANALFLR